MEHLLFDFSNYISEVLRVNDNIYKVLVFYIEYVCKNFW